MSNRFLAMQTVSDSLLALFNTFLNHFPGRPQRLKEATPFSQNIMNTGFHAYSPQKARTIEAITLLCIEFSSRRVAKTVWQHPDSLHGGLQLSGRPEYGTPGSRELMFMPRHIVGTLSIIVASEQTAHRTSKLHPGLDASECVRTQYTVSFLLPTATHFQCCIATRINTSTDGPNYSSFIWLSPPRTRHGGLHYRHSSLLLGPQVVPGTYELQETGDFRYILARAARSKYWIERLPNGDHRFISAGRVLAAKSTLVPRSAEDAARTVPVVRRSASSPSREIGYYPYIAASEISESVTCAFIPARTERSPGPLVWIACKVLSALNQADSHGIDSSEFISALLWHQHAAHGEHSLKTHSLEGMSSMNEHLGVESTTHPVSLELAT
ncbi:hypothetical protein DFH06DRAFT_1122172 [Mycena polygramma]|nr:hypothetical protein DFH06DRAFT_1122172 [Mycena polygramma]